MPHKDQRQGSGTGRAGGHREHVGPRLARDRDGLVGQQAGGCPGPSAPGRRVCRTGLGRRCGRRIAWPGPQEGAPAAQIPSALQVPETSGVVTAPGGTRQAGGPAGLAGTRLAWASDSSRPEIPRFPCRRRSSRAPSSAAARMTGLSEAFHGSVPG